jgi:hypothetical protein
VILNVVRRGLSYPLVAGPSNLALLSRCGLFCFLVFASFARGSTTEHQACGEPFDPAALRRVRTFCVDTSNLEPLVAADVAALVAKENRPHNLLKHMAWTLTDRCAEADAVIRVYFAPSEQHVRIEHTPENIGPALSYSNFVEPATEVVLWVYDRASLRVLYRTEVHSQKTKPAALLKDPFSRLVKETKELQSLKSHRASRARRASATDQKTNVLRCR